MIYYMRNNVDNLIWLKYNNNTFYYVKNLQNDIIGILDSTYNLIVNYKYDSLENILSITDSDGNDIIDSNHIGIINSFRYRSYYYDTETNLYYLNSRYCSTVLRRFLNTDTVLGANQDIMAYNLYNYCGNNPISKIDMYGQSSAYYLAIQKELVKMVNRVYKKSTMQNFEYFDMPENPKIEYVLLYQAKSRKKTQKIIKRIRRKIKEKR